MVFDLIGQLRRRLPAWRCHLSLTVFSDSGSVFGVCSGVGSSALLMNQIIAYSILLCKYERYNDILSQGLALLRRLTKMLVVSDGL